MTKNGTSEAPEARSPRRRMPLPQRGDLRERSERPRGTDCADILATRFFIGFTLVLVEFLGATDNPIKNRVITQREPIWEQQSNSRR